MDIPGVEPHISEFVRALLGAGLWLSETAADIIEGIPDDAYPGEDPAEVVLEMVCGTIATALRPVDVHEVERATELIELARDRTLEHLRLALEVSRRRRKGEGGMGQAYG